MLVLSRRKNEAICLAGNITITVVEIRGNKVRLGIEAPRDVSVHRREVYDAVHAWHDADAPEAQPVRSSEPISLSAHHAALIDRLRDEVGLATGHTPSRNETVESLLETAFGNPQGLVEAVSHAHLQTLASEIAKAQRS